MREKSSRFCSAKRAGVGGIRPERAVKGAPEQQEETRAGPGE